MVMRVVLKRIVPKRCMSLGAIKLETVQHSAATKPDNSAKGMVLPYERLDARSNKSRSLLMAYNKTDFLLIRLTSWRTLSRPMP